RGPAEEMLPVSVVRGEQSNTSVVYGDRLILKLYRRVREGVNPDLEVGRFLTERTRFSHAAAVAGAIEYRAGRAAPTTVAMLQQSVPSAADACRYTLDPVR